MKTIVLLMLLTAAGAANAEEEGRFYLGGAFGMPRVSGACAGEPATVSCSDADGPAFKLALGYQVNPRFGVEFAYANLGSIQRRDRSIFGHTVDIDLSTLELSALGMWPLAANWDLQARLGAYVTAEPRTVHIDTESEASTGGGGATIGLGVRYRASDDAFVRFEWQRYGSFPFPSSSMNASGITIDVFTIGFIYLPGGR